MAKLDLRIILKDNKTLTRIGKAKDNEKVVFHNESAGLLKVTIDRTDVLCDINGDPFSARTFTVAAGNEKSFKVCSDVKSGTELKYTAQIDDFTAEDPIIIIEK